MLLPAYIDDQRALPADAVDLDAAAELFAQRMLDGRQNRVMLVSILGLKTKIVTKLAPHLSAGRLQVEESVGLGCWIISLTGGVNVATIGS